MNLQPFNKSKTFSTPGVGEYESEKIDLKKREPVCVFGNFPRFNNIPSLQRYTLNLPASYQTNLNDSMSITSLGKIGREERFKDEKQKSPGPGSYDT